MFIANCFYAIFKPTAKLVIFAHLHKRLQQKQQVVTHSCNKPARENHMVENLTTLTPVMVRCF